MAKSPEQKAAEALEKLKSKAAELGVEFTDETSADELAELVKAAEAAAKPTKSKKTSFAVYNKGSALVRTYSVEAHGSEAGELAAEYAKKIGGEVR